MLNKRREETNGLITRYVNGVEKLKTTSESVGVLQEEVAAKSIEVEAALEKVAALVPNLEAEKAKAGDEAARANEIASAATIKEAEVLAMKASIEKDLEAAEPALVAAAAALDSINKKDLGELKNLGKPPAGIDDVTGACIYLLHPTGKGKIDVSWKAAQGMMKDVNAFLEMLLNYKGRIDGGQVPKQNFKNIRPLLELEHFNVPTMTKKSSAAAGLTDFVINITVYWDINEDVEPKRLAAESATAQLDEAVAAKEAALAKKAEAEATVAELEAAYAAAVAEKEAKVAEGEACQRKLGLANRLMSALGSSAVQWEAAIVDLNANLEVLAGRRAARRRLRLLLGLLLEEVPRQPGRRHLPALPQGTDRRRQGRRAHVGERRRPAQHPHDRGAARGLGVREPADRPRERRERRHRRRRARAGR